MKVIVKIGGGSDSDAASIAADVAALTAAGHRTVLVHGGSIAIERLADRLDVPQRVLVAPDGVTSRYTDQPTLDVITLALRGQVAPGLVAAFARAGVTAAALSGTDGAILRARRKRAHRATVDGRTMIVRDNHSGVVSGVNTGLLESLLDAGVIPVVGPPALDENGRTVNVNADRAAAAVAAAFGADLLVMLTGAPGVLRDPADDGSVLANCEIPPGGAGLPWAKGGMALKLIAAAEALRGGVGEVRIADGRGRHPVRAALDGAGSRVRLAEEAEVVR